MTISGDAIGLVAGRYTLGQTLGRGGMGQVYRATDQVLGREVAIKLLLPVRETLAAVERFEREARAAAMLSDPHVVAAYDFGPHGGGYFLAMELVEGSTVSEELRRNGPLPAERAVDIITQAAAGVAAAHRAGIIHRDIKPGNLLLTGGGQVKVADFGIARILDDTTTTLTATGQIVGTSHYLSPERASGKPAEGPSDVYSLGCVLYQLVTGHPPFMAQDPASIMYQHVETTPTPPSDLRPELAGEFEALLFWLLAKDPALRPTAAQVAQRVPPPVIMASEFAITERTALLSRAGRSRKAIAAAAAALTLALAATTGILLTTNTTRHPVTNDLRTDPSATTPTPRPGRTTGVSKPATTPAAHPIVTVTTTPASPPPQTHRPEQKATSVDRNTAKPPKPDRPHTKKPKKRKP